MTLMQVLYALEVARCRNISKAAENLLVSQPALSQQIRNLEDELGCPLFRRESKGLSITAAGHQFCEDARLVEEAWTRLQESCRSLNHAVCQTVRIGLGPRAISNGLFDVVDGFFERYPDTNVTYVTDVALDVLAALEEKRLDIALARLPLEEDVKNPDHFYVSELIRERQCVLMSPEDPRMENQAYAFKDIHGSDIVSGPVGSVDDMVMRRACLRYQVTVGRVYRADSIHSVMSLIRNGKGLALGPASFAEKYGVGAVPMLPETYVSLNLICLKQNWRNPVVVQLERELRRFLGAG